VFEAVLLLRLGPGILRPPLLAVALSYPAAVTLADVFGGPDVPGSMTPWWPTLEAPAISRARHRLHGPNGQRLKSSKFADGPLQLRTTGCVCVCP